MPSSVQKTDGFEYHRNVFAHPDWRAFCIHYRALKLILKSSPSDLSMILATEIDVGSLEHFSTFFNSKSQPSIVLKKISSFYHNHDYRIDSFKLQPHDAKELGDLESLFLTELLVDLNRVVLSLNLPFSLETCIIDYSPLQY